MTLNILCLNIYFYSLLSLFIYIFHIKANTFLGNIGLKKCFFSSTRGGRTEIVKGPNQQALKNKRRVYALRQERQRDPLDKKKHPNKWAVTLEELIRGWYVYFIRLHWYLAILIMMLVFLVFYSDQSFRKPESIMQTVFFPVFLIC